MPELDMRPDACEPVDKQSIDVDNILSRIRAMQHQETSAYSCIDYFRPQEDNINVARALPQNPQVSEVVDRTCRRKITSWCYQVVDQCRFKRETVYIAMNYLDRFLATPSGIEILRCRTKCRLAAMTCLYMSIKLFEVEKVGPSYVYAICRGAFSEEDITEMEMNVLSALNWRVQPPTPLSFVQHYIALLGTELVPESTLSLLLRYSQYQTELAVFDENLITSTPSTIAVASLLNSVDVILEGCIPYRAKQKLQQSISFVILATVNAESATHVKATLCELLEEHGGDSGLGIECLSSFSEEDASTFLSSRRRQCAGYTSPRCISATCTQFETKYQLIS